MMCGKFSADLSTVPVPELKDDEVQVKAIRSLISTGTELRQYTKSRDYYMHRTSASPALPQKTSYNVSGIVVAVGKDIKDYEPGDEVYCLANHEQYINCKPYRLTKKPEWVSHDENAWMTVLRTGFMACKEVELKPYDTIVIAGLGIFGFATLMLAKVYNARNIIVVEPNEFRAKKAAKYGATYVINKKMEESVDDILKWNHGKYVDAAVDCTSWGGNLQYLQQCVKRNGNLVVICDPPNLNDQKLNYGCLFYRTQHIHGVYINQMLDQKDPMYYQKEFVNTEYPMTMESIHDFIYEKMKTGEIDVKGLITGYSSPEQCDQIYQKLIDNEAEDIGVLYDWTVIE